MVRFDAYSSNLGINSSATEKDFFIPQKFLNPYLMNQPKPQNQPQTHYTLKAMESNVRIHIYFELVFEYYYTPIIKKETLVLLKVSISLDWFMSEICLKSRILSEIFVQNCSKLRFICPIIIVRNSNVRNLTVQNFLVINVFFARFCVRNELY